MELNRLSVNSSEVCITMLSSASMSDAWLSKRLTSKRRFKLRRCSGEVEAIRHTNEGIKELTKSNLLKVLPHRQNMKIIA